ncbi:MAG: S9 family peptidase [Acidobacteriota bacterium]
MSSDLTPAAAERPPSEAGRVRRRALTIFSASVIALMTLASVPAESAAAGLTVAQMNALRSVGGLAVSPSGDLVAYTLTVPRDLRHQDNGPADRELHVLSLKTGISRPFITGEVRVSSPQFTADGALITYMARRHGDTESALWAIPVEGGESRRLMSMEGMTGYRLSPTGRSVAVLAVPPVSEAREEAKDKGFDREVFEEEWRAQEVWIETLPEFLPAPVDPEAEEADAEDEEAEGPRHVELDGSAADVRWSGDGARLAVAVQPRNLVDDSLMFKRLRVLDASSGEVLSQIANPGKLGSFALSPDGEHLAMISAADLNDPSQGRLMVAEAAGSGEIRDLMADYEVHVRSFVWRDGGALYWSADEGSETTLGTVDLSGQRELLARSNPGLGVPIASDLHLSAEGALLMRGQTPGHPNELFSFKPGGRPQRLTDSNPWLAGVELARQEVITWTASDGLEIEGILIHPLDGRRPAPLILMVHGGPEANDRNGWVTGYSRPGQIAAAAGYAVLYPNYRGSTGRGVAFSKLGQGDAAGGEFRDLVEAVDHLAEIGVADPERVGITGGSYGGYATAWGSTFYTDRFRAGVMFVGISNKLSKGFTTDIPHEDVLVHTLFEPWTKWQFSLERSPLFHAEKSKTPLLIGGGTADTRVHPSQSLQLYRALKKMGKTVRYVRYPGEPHGNRRAASQEDYTRRLLRWMDHFLIDGATELPPVELE